MCEGSDTKLNFVSSRLCYANCKIECMLGTETKVRHDHLWLLGLIRAQLFSGEIVFFLILWFSPFRALKWEIGDLGVAVEGSIVVDAIISLCANGGRHFWTNRSLVVCIFQSRGAAGDVTWMAFLTEWQGLLLLFGTVPPVVILWFLGISNSNSEFCHESNQTCQLASVVLPGWTLETVKGQKKSLLIQD